MLLVVPFAVLGASLLSSMLVSAFTATPLVSTGYNVTFSNSSDYTGAGEANFQSTVELVKFGTFQGGGGVNWGANQYGGGYNAGTIDDETGQTNNGVGGGYTIDDKGIQLGGGIQNRGESVNFQLYLANDGSASITVNTSASALTCQPDGPNGMKCTILPNPIATNL